MHLLTRPRREQLARLSKESIDSVPLRLSYSAPVKQVFWLLKSPNTLFCGRLLTHHSCSHSSSNNFVLIYILIYMLEYDRRAIRFQKIGRSTALILLILTLPFGHQPRVIRLAQQIHCRCCSGHVFEGLYRFDLSPFVTPHLVNSLTRSTGCHSTSDITRSSLTTTSSICVVS